MKLVLTVGKKNRHDAARIRPRSRAALTVSGLIILARVIQGRWPPAPVFIWRRVEPISRLGTVHTWRVIAATVGGGRMRDGTPLTLSASNLGFFLSQDFFFNQSRQKFVFERWRKREAAMRIYECRGLERSLGDIKNGALPDAICWFATWKTVTLFISDFFAKALEQIIVRRIL